jgi:phosphoglycerate dehydrogenase-like enzyme
LVDKLNRGELYGAALDVFSQEPIEKNSKLWDIANLIITPHIAGKLTNDYTIEVCVNMFLDNLRRWSRNEELTHVVDRIKEY